MKLKFSTLGAVALMLGVLPTSGRAADVKDFVNLCTAGAIQTCASIQVTTVWDGSRTLATIRVRNLQGFLADDNTGGSLITGIAVTNPYLAGVLQGSPFVMVEGTATQVGDAAGQWSVTFGPKLGMGSNTVFFGSTSGNSKGGILGCDPTGSMSKYFQTCGDGGWVVFSFSSSTRWSADEAEVGFKTQSVAVNGNSYECVTNDGTGDKTCSYTIPPTDVVPEPITMVLLGSGLAGIGGVRLRRRRREEAGAVGA